MNNAASNRWDVAIYVGLAGVTSAQAVKEWDWRAGLSVIGAMLIAWKAVRHIPKAGAPDDGGPKS